ncbi:SDR family oxidoreductase [Microlunatus sp. Gsoil 973]|uniref:SDR family oxidoreductase n=1 Tax=Microlunatus sp. Gsoil 973 TaxID=2672569 RepID=UPI0012B4CE5A|nr:SDR family oxidoreductase [Microlunatus sp. Gsoil 973]QGN31553.1 SDR family oxidoreductase [Microlunatus sp. Gsoil 973]
MSDDHVALITGASRGLGRAMAETLAAQGFRVAINYASSHDAACAVRDRIVAAGGRAEVFAADVTDESAVTELGAAITETLGPVDVLVLNATGPQPAIPIEDLEWSDMLQQLEFFVKSPLLLTRAFLPTMKSRGWGRIIQIGSEVFTIGNANSSAYVSAKGAQLGLTRSWARELGPYGITVNLVAPGWIPVERHEGTAEEDFAGYLRDVPLGHMGTADDVAGAVAYLASDAGRFVTGQQLSVNGGRTFG